MCGIFGSAFEPPEREIRAERALESLRLRGPDARGLLRLGDVLLGHTRLKIIDLTDGAAQPMKSADGLAVVVFNGEIYNHHELRHDLEQHGTTFRSRSDTEVIVEGYRRHGTAFLERLDGMFAIAVYDVKERKLVLARDRVGKKPLFYARDGRGIRFASSARALLASGLDSVVDVRSFPMLLALGYVPPPRTLYANVAQLPPATILELGAEGDEHVRCYWRAPFDAPTIRTTEAEASQGVRRLLESGVRRRLEADVPLGAFLSGGIDSTIVVGLMARASSKPVKTFSIGFAGDAAFDETDYARIAARAFQSDHTEFTLEPKAFDLLDDLVLAHDGPFGDSSAVPTSVVAMLTRQHVTVALSGDGGDELFAGYSRFLAAAAAERIPSALRQIGWVAASRMPRSRPLNRVRRLAQIASMPLVDRMLRWQSYFVEDLRALFRADLRTEMDIEAGVRWSHELVRRTQLGSPLTQALQYNFDSYLPHDLLVKADRASMLHSLEVRSPFLDTQLIEYAARLPDRLRARGRTTKWILRRAFRDLIPAAILRRGKMGFGMPLATWFRGSLRQLVRDTLGSNAKIGHYLDMDYVSSVLDAHDRGERDMQHPIWLLLTMERWLHLQARWAS